MKETILYGKLLILVGILGFIALFIISATKYSGLDQGAIAAGSFLFIILGLVFAFPTLLQDTTGQASTMRIIVLIVVLVFAILYIKIGWQAGTYADFRIDNTWVYILGLAFGSKVFQKFAEKDENSNTPGPPQNNNTTNTGGNTDIPK